MNTDTAQCPCRDGYDEPKLVHGVPYCHEPWRDTGDPTHAQYAMDACKRGDTESVFFPPPTGVVDEYGDQICDCY